MKKLKGEWKQIWFDENNCPVIINGKAQRNIETGEELFYYGESLSQNEHNN